jgi:hypothetical protein
MSEYAKIIGLHLYVDFIFLCPRRTGKFASTWVESFILKEKLDIWHNEKDAQKLREAVLGVMK